MSKYSDDILEVRKISGAIIPKLLADKSRTLEYIFSIIKNKYSKNCDDKIKCKCGKTNRSIQEWKHQVRWAIQDLKYSKKLVYDKESRLYSLIKK